MSGMTDAEALRTIEALAAQAVLAGTKSECAPMEAEAKVAIDHIAARLRGGGEQGQAVAYQTRIPTGEWREASWETYDRVSHNRPNDDRALYDRPQSVTGDAARRLVGLMSEVVPALEATGLNVSLAADVKAAAAALSTQPAPSEQVAPPVPSAPEWPGDGWLEMATAPRDGTLIRLLVDFTENATEDSDRAPTIGSNSFDNTGLDEWDFAGWSWEQGCYTQGEGTPVGWLPMLIESGQVAASVAVQRLVDSWAVSRTGDSSHPYRITDETESFAWEPEAGSFGAKIAAAICADRAAAPVAPEREG